jgi:hypothetical protein
LGDTVSDPESKQPQHPISKSRSRRGGGVVRGPEAGLGIEPLPVGLRWTYLSRPGRPSTDEVLAALIARIAGRTRPGATAGARANGLVATRRERGSASPATVELQNVASWRSLACEGRLVILEAGS